MKSIILFGLSLCLTGTINAQILVSTKAGAGTAGYLDGAATSAQFNNPYGVAADNNGNIYIADSYNHRIRKISAAGVVSTLAGSGSAGFQDGPASSAQFNYPTDVKVDAAGNVFVCDNLNHRIRKISVSGTVSTVAGSGATGAGLGSFADGNATTQAKFKEPKTFWVMPNGDIVVGDYENHRIRKISNGVVTTIAGSGIAGYLDGPGSTARFNKPDGICADNAGNIYVSDIVNNRIRMISAATGDVSTYAGNSVSSSTDGTGTSASFNGPVYMAIDNFNNIYLPEAMGNKIRKIAPGGVVTTIAGTGSAGYLDGPGTSAMFNFPIGICISGGDILVADRNNNRIRSIAYGVSIEETNAIHFSLYPNPAVNEITIKFEHVMESATVEMFDMSGRKVCGFDEKSVQNLIVDLTKVSEGQYLVKITSTEGIATKRISLVK